MDLTVYLLPNLFLDKYSVVESKAQGDPEKIIIIKEVLENYSIA